MCEFDNPLQAPQFASAAGSQDARDLQSLLYREIGISAVAAALFATHEMDRAPHLASEFSRERLENLPGVLRGERAA